jgi:para-aminobenzoate synthetase/4-amino-4-deoxychorismate lyase
MQQSGTVICRLPGDNANWGLFSKPEHIVAPRTPDAVIEAIEYVERCLDAGMYATGFIAYEAATAFELNATTKELDDNFPLAWFALYSKSPKIFNPTAIVPCEPLTAGEPELSPATYANSLNSVKDELEQGNIYQANFTFRTHGQSIMEPEQFFLHLFNIHPAPYAAFINTGDLQIISNSPELFLHKIGTKIVSSPMKGTAKRHSLPTADRKIAELLPLDPKTRAENLMITDMVRNDLGRICIPGTVHTEPLFQVDTYNTLHQMISTVSGELEPNSSLQTILNATFPPASITGAPKLSAMNLIKQLEKSPRKLYTGSIGAFMPNGDCCLNVAIRTLINSAQGSELGVGGGIVYDSEIEAEWHEALLKSQFTRFVQPKFELLETMLYEQGEILWFNAHLDRIGASQQYFNRPWDRDDLIRTVTQAVKNITAPCRIRLLLNSNGKITLENYPLTHIGWGVGAHRLKISPLHTDSKNLFLYHKTTLRDFYNQQFTAATAAGFAEVVFTNERHELTEGSISSIFIQQNAQWRTPALECGLLPGIWRQKMLKELNAVEAIISLNELVNADKIIIGNSVRGKLEITSVIGINNQK